MSANMNLTREYLGDSVYIYMEAGQFVLVTNNGDGWNSNVIFLEPEVAEALVRYIQRATEGPQT